MPEKRKAVYLIGTGATHAEIRQRDLANPGLLMPQVTSGVFSELMKDNVPDLSLRELLDTFDTTEPDPYNIDIESVITLYESAGTAIDIERANTLKIYFRKIISERTRKVKILEGHPKLLTALLDMYSVSDFDEELQAIITLNYDDFIEQAFVNVYDGVNYPFEIDKSYTFTLNSSLPPLCKLHGSFNWENTNPVRIHDDFSTNNEEEVLWVPPGVVKRIDYYPFNAIWGTARANLKCDVLRIIGCSMSRNDWSLIALLHTTHRLRYDINEKYEIQFIDYPKSFDKAWDEFPYFGKLKSVTQLTEFDLYMRAEHKAQYDLMEGDTDKEKMDKWLNTNKKSFNIFAEWLKAMAYYLRLEKRIDISTEKGYFESFFLNGG